MKTQRIEARLQTQAATPLFDTEKKALGEKLAKKYLANAKKELYPQFDLIVQKALTEATVKTLSTVKKLSKGLVYNLTNQILEGGKGQIDRAEAKTIAEELIVEMVQEFSWEKTYAAYAKQEANDVSEMAGS